MYKYTSGFFARMINGVKANLWFFFFLITIISMVYQVLSTSTLKRDLDFLKFDILNPIALMEYLYE